MLTAFLFLSHSSYLYITLPQASHHSHFTHLFLLTRHHPVGVSPHDLQSARPCPHVRLSLSKPFNPSRKEFILCQRSDHGCGTSLDMKRKDTHVHLKGSWPAQPPPSHLLSPHCLIKTDLSEGAADDRRKWQRCIVEPCSDCIHPKRLILLPSDGICPTMALAFKASLCLSLSAVKIRSSAAHWGCDRLADHWKKQHWVSISPFL